MMNEINNVINDNVNVTFKEILEYKIFSLGKYNLTVYEIIGAFMILIIGLVVSKIIRRLIYKSERFDLGKKFAFSQVFHYVIVIIMFFLVMKMLGLDMSPLLVGSSVILVGIGLGLQNLFLDFISGIIILLDRTIRVGDVVDLDGIIGEVQEIKMRTTTILTRDNKSIIFPNSVLTKNRLVNFSHNDEVVAFEITVGVHYDTDLELLEKLMVEAALEHESVLKDPLPSVRLENFGDSSLDFKMFYHTKNLFRQPTMRSNIRKSILRKFRENEINIPYPIRTLDFPKNTFQ